MAIKSERPHTSETTIISSGHRYTTTTRKCMRPHKICMEEKNQIRWRENINNNTNYNVTESERPQATKKVTVISPGRRHTTQEIAQGYPKCV